MNAIVSFKPAADVQSESTSLAIAESLQRHADAARGAYASNTERALRADVAIFTSWCSSLGLLPLPATPDTVARFIDAMAATKAPATIRRYVSSVSTFHRAAGVESPGSALEVKLALKRLHREKGRAQAQAAPLTRQLIDRMLSAGGQALRDLRNRAVLAVAYDTLCRRSELASLMLEDLEVGPDGAATITVRRSKTDQEGAGMVRFLAADTVRHLKAWVAAAKIESGPIFRSVRKGGRISDGLDASEIARLFKAMALAAGVPPDDAARISGHSSRVGAAQDMVRVGVELPAIMQAGGWKTAEMVSRYTRRLDARHSGSAKLAMMQNRG